MRALVLAVLTAAGCGLDVEPPPDPVPEPSVTWFHDVGPIVAARCMGCHQTDGLAPFALETYDDAAPVARRMLAAVQSGLMPPWGATASPDCTPIRPWRDDPRLAPAEVDLLARWIDEGLPVGEPAALVPTELPHLDGVTHSMTPVQPHVSAGPRDELICYPLDPQIASDMWMTGWEVRPGNPDVVHHVILQVMPPEILAAARQYDLVGKELPCNLLVEATQTLGAWTPGQEPFETPAGVGLPLPAGSGIWIQIHYHPGAGENPPDATTVNLRMTSTPPDHSYSIGFFGNAGAAPVLRPDPDDRTSDPEFRIPAGSSHHVETMRAELHGPRVPVFVAQPHMHYVGTHLELIVDRANPPPGEPAHECLIDSTWNFDWQRTYRYDAPIESLPTLGEGDTLELRCTYDNSIANPFVQRALEERGLVAPVDVYYGEGASTDEMCLGILGAISP